MSEQTEEQFDEWARIMRAFRLVEALLDRDMHDSELQVTEYEVLTALFAAEGGWMRMSTLADAVVQSRSRLTHTATRLEKRGWVRRRPSKEDRRGIELALSESGRARYLEVQERYRRHARAIVFSHVDGADFEAMTRVASRLIEVNEPLIGPRGI